MTVLFVVSAYPRRSGDVITPWLTETIRRLQSVGVGVEVLAPAYRGEPDQVVDGVRVHRFRYAPSGWETLTHDQTAPDRVRERPWYLPLVPLYMISGCLRARQLTRTGRFDVIHVFWPIPHGIMGIVAKSGSGAPLVCTFFGVELTWMRSQLRFLAPILRWIVRSSDAVTAISTYTAGLVRAHVPGTPVEIVPFGAAIDALPSRIGIETKASSSTFELLFVGRLVERKGVQYLLEALAMLRSRGRDVLLTVIGGGPFGGALRARCEALGLQEWVRFEGYLPEAEVADRFARCDAFVLPAVRDSKGDVEGLGVVLIEALLFGRPVIASDAGGIPDVVRDGETGLLVRPGDAAHLAEAIERYMDHPEMAAAHAAAGREDVEARFSWDAIVQRLQQVYAAVNRSR